MPARQVDDEDLLAAAAESRSMSALLRRVGLVDVGGNYASIRARLEGLGALEPRFAARQPDRPRVLVERAEAAALTAALASARTLKEVLLALGVPPSRTAYEALHDRARRDGIDLSSVRRGRPPRRRRDAAPRTPLDQVLVRGRSVRGSGLVRRLLDAGLVEDCCAGCGGTGWQGGPIPLELDHVNGDRTDNRVQNLRLLCPNCHALTPTWRGRNIARRREAV